MMSGSGTTLYPFSTPGGGRAWPWTDEGGGRVMAVSEAERVWSVSALAKAKGDAPGFADFAAG